MSLTRVAVVKNTPYLTAHLLRLGNSSMHIMETYRSIMVSKGGGLYRPVAEILSTRCIQPVWYSQVDDPDMVMGRAESEGFLVYEECPAILHECALDLVPRPRRPEEVGGRWQRRCSIGQ